VGTLVVGIASAVGPTHPVQAPRPVLGAVLVTVGRFLGAVQGVLEEKFVSRYEVPAMQAVGWEGVWGLGMIVVVLAIGYFIPMASQPTGRAADFVDAALMIAHDWRLALAVAADVFFVSGFMWFLYVVMLPECTRSRVGRKGWGHGGTFLLDVHGVAGCMSPST